MGIPAPNRSILSLGLFACICMIISACKAKPSVVYVDNSLLLEKAVLFIRARDSLKAFNESWKRQAESLRDSVDNYMKLMGGRSTGLSRAEVDKTESEFKARQETLSRFVAANQARATELEKSLFEPNLKRLNAYVQTFREKKGYALILGTTIGGNILAADKSLDITDKIIDAINRDLR